MLLKLLRGPCSRICPSLPWTSTPIIIFNVLRGGVINENGLVLGRRRSKFKSQFLGPKDVCPLAVSICTY